MLIAVGALAWCFVEGGLVERLVLLSVLVLVPLAARTLLGASALRELLTLVGGLGAAFGGGPGSYLWLAASVGLAFTAAASLRVDRPMASLATLPPLCFPVVGAIWWVAARNGLSPLGFEEPIVSLTAAHFHHAAVVPQLSAAMCVRRGHAAWLALALALLPPLVGLGIAWSPGLEAFAALSFAGALAALAVVQLGVSRRLAGTSLPVAALLGAGSLFLVAGTLLGAWYALGEATGLAAPSIPTMIQTHAVLNGLGFGLCTVVGWALAARLDPHPTEENA